MDTASPSFGAPKRVEGTPERVQVIDCTLREGDQSTGVWLDPEDKLAIFRLLDEAGVALVDAGMPAISQSERDLLTALSGIEGRRARVAASVRARPEEIALAAECGVDEVFLIYPVSRLHREKRLRLELADWTSLGREALIAAREAGLVANLVMEDASRAPTDELTIACELAAEYEADRVMVCDTVGVLTPRRAYELVKQVVDILGDGVAVGTHFHDDLGMATANTVAGVEAGAAWPSVTVNGVGERAGNAVLAEVAMACAVRLRCDTGIDAGMMVPLSRAVERRTGIYLAADAPIVGPATFDHESGIHVDGVLKAPETYESIAPGSVGRQSRITYGKHTGRNGLTAFAEEHGLDTRPEVVAAVLRRLKSQRPTEYQATIDRFLRARDRYLLAERGVSGDALAALFRDAAVLHPAPEARSDAGGGEGRH